MEGRHPPWARNPVEPPSELNAIAQKAIDVYFASKQRNGEIGGIGWWQTANGYTAIALHDNWSGSKHNYDTLSRATRQCEKSKSGLINEYNDDTLWWGLLCLHVYTLGQEDFFLQKAKAIWQHVEKGNVCMKGEVRFQDMDMEGACYWTSNSGEEQINAITTGLFAELGIRLAMLEIGSAGDKRKKHKHRLTSMLHRKEVTREEYIEAARCSLGWILRCRYRQEHSIVLDNILLKKEEARDWTFTYITGVALGVCALLYQATNEKEYLDLAYSMAPRAMQRPSWVDDNGVLTERDAYGKGKHKPEENSDAVGFKSILIRHLGVLYDVIRKTSTSSLEAVNLAALIKQFINVNLQSQLEHNNNGNGQYGPWWNGPFEMPTSHSQMAVLDVMAAAKLVNRA